MKKVKLWTSLFLVISMTVVPIFTFALNEEILIYPKEEMEELSGENWQAQDLDEEDVEEVEEVEEVEDLENEEYALLEEEIIIENFVLDFSEDLTMTTPCAISFTSQEVELDYGTDISSETVTLGSYLDLPTGLEGSSKAYCDKTGKFISGWKDEQGNTIKSNEDLIGKTKLIALWGEKFSNKKEINDFTTSFKSMLKERAIGEIELVIPEDTTKITDNAFYSKTNCPSFSKVDFSLATGLTYIGSNSFNGKITGGDIIIPDSVETIRYSAFMGCTTTGELKLPNNPKFTTIEYQTFLKVPLTGKLIIPDSVTVIGQKAFEETKFSGELVLPKNLVTLGKIENGDGAVFNGCSGFTSIVWPANNTLKFIGSSTFKGTNMFSGKLILPDSIETIVSQAFYGTNVEVVYMPKSYKHTVYSGKGNSPFYNCPNLRAVIFDTKEQYDEIKQHITSTSSKFAYEIDLNFDMGNFPSEEKLFGLPVNMVKDQTDNQDKPNWIIDSNYTLPVGDINQGKTYRWSAVKGGSYIGNASILNTTTLYGDISLTAPKVSISADYREPEKKFTKVYDGVPKEFKVTVTHPEMGKDMEVLYVWHKSSTRERIIMNIGSDNSMAITNVDESRYGQNYPSEDGKGDYIQCGYSVRVYIIDKTKPASTIYVDDSEAPNGKRSYDIDGKLIYTFSEVPIFMEITPAESIVNPKIEISDLKEGDSLPVIQLSQGDTQGLITWIKPDYKLLSGNNECEWKFTPSSNNYKEQTGSVTLNAKAGQSQEKPEPTPPKEDSGSKEEVKDKEEIKVTDTGTKTEVEVKVESKIEAGEQSSTISLNSVEALVKETEKSNTGKPVEIAIKLNTEQEVSKLSLNIPKDAATILADVSDSLVIQNEKVDMILGKELLQTMVQGDKDISISVEKVNHDSLTPEIYSIIGDRPVLEFKIKSGEDDIHDFGDNYVTLHMNYIPKADENVERLKGVYIDDTGNIEYLNDSKYIKSSNMLEIKTNHFSKFSIAQVNAPHMIDIQNHWAQNSIEKVLDRGLMVGIDENHFAPEQSVSRAMAVCVLAQLEKVQNQATTMPFKDVTMDSWYVNQVSWAKEKGYIKGVEEELFAPNKDLSREEFAVILSKYLGGENLGYSQYNDNNIISSWALESVNKLSGLGVINGDENNNFNPQNPITRGELATIIVNLQNIN